ncbi:cell wall hydrolase [Microvirga flavescens]|uniref:cell wall hydrolase n=1 Tax=Microvirga flavescens TaxID=2249811 RepID=UPI000DDB1D74|nr:cell wall hydrolase [Microvirga flavescens]
MRWIVATVAPWALAAGLLVSFTASASNDARSGISAANRSAVAYLTEANNLVPLAGTASDVGRWNLSNAILRNIPRYDLPDESRLANVPPRHVLKTGAGAYPTVERKAKGNPAVAQGPNLSRQAKTGLAEFGTAGTRVFFSRDERLLPPTVLMTGKLEAPSLEGERFEPWQAPELTTTRQATSIQSPAAAAAGSTGAAASTKTPKVSRAVALSSTTPALSDATPMEIAAAPVSKLDRHGADTSIVNKNDDERPRYAELIDPDNLSKEQRCLAEAVYFEARSEPETGQAAVAQVVLNRVKSGLYPASICGVVYQNRHRHLACQFTFACEGKALRITEPESWESAKRVAGAVLDGRTYLAEVGGSTHYHADYVKPYWARRLKKMDVIGRHIFYKLKPGQT